jgi:glycine cleavage system regulatory protein
VPRIVLTAIGDDRAGLVEALADVIARHGGNWERSQLAELAGKFAGIVVVVVAQERLQDLTEALWEIDGLTIAAYPGSGPSGSGARSVTIDLLGNDRPGIVREVSAVLHRNRLSIDTIETATREAPMAGGQLFEAHIVVRVPQDGDLSVVREDLERLASELLVDIALTGQ